MADLAEIIGKNIKARRKAKGWTQQQLGQAVLGVAHNGPVSLWESGKFSPGAFMLLQLSRAFGCTIDALFEGAEHADA